MTLMNHIRPGPRPPLPAVAPAGSGRATEPDTRTPITRTAWSMTKVQVPRRLWQRFHLAFGGRSR